MTYIESVLGDFIKSILTRGIKTLKSERFFPYTAVLLIIVIFSTSSSFFSKLIGISIDDNFINFVLFIELSAALGFIIVGIAMGRQSAKIQIPIMIVLISIFSYLFIADYISSEISIYIGGFLYILWISIVTFSTFSLFKDLFGNDIFGTILFLGKQEDDGRALFSFLGIIMALINFSLGYLLYTKSENSKSLLFTSLVIMIFAIIAFIPLLNLQSKNDVFFSVLNFFYMFSTIKVFLLVFRVITNTSGDTSLWDTIFSMFMALYAIQGAAVKGVRIATKSTDLSIEEQLLEDSKDLGFTRQISKLLSDRGIVMVILGVLLGYHSMQIQASFGRDNLFQDITILAGSDIVVLGYEFSLIISLFIFILSIILFILFSSFRKYANPEVNRIPWAPDYSDLKVTLAGIKSGDVSWKGDAAKLVIGLAGDKLKEKFGIKKKSGNRIENTFSKLLGKSKKGKKE